MKQMANKHTAILKELVSSPESYTAGKVPESCVPNTYSVRIQRQDNRHEKPAVETGHASPKPG